MVIDYYRLMATHYRFSIDRMIIVTLPLRARRTIDATIDDWSEERLISLSRNCIG